MAAPPTAAWPSVRQCPWETTACGSRWRRASPLAAVDEATVLGSATAWRSWRGAGSRPREVERHEELTSPARRHGRNAVDGEMSGGCVDSGEIGKGGVVWPR